jgi:hypothetical protein
MCNLSKMIIFSSVVRWTSQDAVSIAISYSDGRGPRAQISASRLAVLTEGFRFFLSLSSKIPE